MSSINDLMQADLLEGQLPAGVDSLAAALQSEFGDSLQAVLMYGSCRRKADASEGLVDLLVIVDNYRTAFKSRLWAMMNWLLPPNVFYLEARTEESVIRCKYAVITLAQFQRRCRARSDHYFWARFSQPMRLVWQRQDIAPALAQARASAALAFSARIAPLLAAGVSAEGFWQRCLAATYRCELRPEPPGNAARLIANDPAYWEQITLAIAEHSDVLAVGDSGYVAGPGGFSPLAMRISWQLRRLGGKLFNLARLFKAAGTFSNGIDYIVWKVERHSGVRIEPTERMRRYPRLAAWGLVWRLWRQGGFR